MRGIYLFRHCKPDFENGKFICLGQNTDISLSEDGKNMAREYKNCVSPKYISAFYTSPMKRCRETAVLISDGRWKICVEPMLTELDSGEWEGLSHDEIKRKYPEIWKARQKGEHITPLGGESDEHGFERMKKALLKILSETDGNLAVVSHGALINSFCRFCEKDEHANINEGKIGFGNVSTVLFDGKNFLLTARNIKPDSAPEKDFSEKLFSDFNVPENIKAHCKKTEEKAMEMEKMLRKNGVFLNSEVISAGAYLHDILRAQPNHSEEGAKLLRKNGYLAVGDTIFFHGGGFSESKFDEKKLVYLADKYISKTDEVTLEERFKKSLKKCKNEKAIEMHALREKEAKAVEKEYKELLSVKGAEQ